MGVGNCNERRQASLLFGITLGEPFREDIVHYAQFLQGSTTQCGKLRGCSRFQTLSLAKSQGARNVGEGRVVYEVLGLQVFLMGAQIFTMGTLKQNKNKTL